jgi:hypothetical protein
LVTAGQELDVKSPGGNHITNKVKINFHVFSTGVEHRIGRQIGSHYIITPKN